MLIGSMKKMVFVIAIFLGVVFSTLAYASAASCNLNAQLINQDPYPANPGDYVKLVFQIGGLSDPGCGLVTVELMDNFPISFDPNASKSVSAQAGFNSQDYSSYFMVPFKVRVDKNALDGDNTIKLKYTSSADPSSVYIVKNFNLAVNGTSTDFDVIVDSYSYATGVLTLDILNKGKNDAEALTAGIPAQVGLTFQGPNTKVIGSLNSKDDTTVSFNAVPSGNSINITLEYNDLANIRRTVQETVPFDAAAYASTKNSGTAKGASYYLLILTWLAIIVFAVYRYRSNKKKKKLEQARRFK